MNIIIGILIGIFLTLILLSVYDYFDTKRPELEEWDDDDEKEL